MSFMFTGEPIAARPGSVDWWAHCSKAPAEDHGAVQLIYYWEQPRGGMGGLGAGPVGGWGGPPRGRLTHGM
jgi:hypothetical protein